MSRTHTLSRELALGAALVLVGCARGVSPYSGDEGEGGAGGEPPASSATGGPAAGCSQDCSLVVTPPCLVSVCDAENDVCRVVPSPEGTTCDDGLFCTVGDQCSQGLCKGGAPNDCGVKSTTCTTVACNEVTKSCAAKTAPDGAACPNQDPCSTSAHCQAGACVGVPKDCHFAPVPDDCHVAVCNPVTGSCEPVVGNEGQSCIKGGDPCVTGKICQGGACLGGTAKDCSALTDGCHAGVCDEVQGACVAQPLPAGTSCGEAADECNAGVCDASGKCARVPTPGVACASATNGCSAGVCDVSGSCVGTPINEGKSCEDGNACTNGEVCSAGSCVGGEAAGYKTYLVETFANNAAGWTLDNEWQIGPASASPGMASYGHEDPATDRTSTSDNGIAGVAIGGYPKEAVHPPRYLVSPAVNANVEGTVWLSFYRYLNSDYAPYMVNTIDVFDGSTWANLWTSGSAPGVKDQAWTLVTHDLTPYKNAALRVRFGFEIGNGGAFIASGWNLDDVVIANAVCESGEGDSAGAP